MIERAKRTTLWLNVFGGIAVLGSYAYGFATHPETSAQVWGGVPEALKPFYTVSMLCAAAGYFAFGYFVFFALDAERTRIAGRFGFRAFDALYALVLLPSALWMPLTFAMLDDPSAPLWWAIRFVLALVGVGSLGLLAAVATADAPGRRVARAVAVAGALAFTFQTAVLDALVWPAFFPAS